MFANVIFNYNFKRVCIYWIWVYPIYALTSSFQAAAEIMMMVIVIRRAEIIIIIITILIYCIFFISYFIYQINTITNQNHLICKMQNASNLISSRLITSEFDFRLEKKTPRPPNAQQWSQNTISQKMFPKIYEHFGKHIFFKDRDFILMANSISSWDALCYIYLYIYLYIYIYIYILCRMQYLSLRYCGIVR